MVIVLEEIFRLISGSLPEDQGGFTCMISYTKMFISIYITMYNIFVTCMALYKM